MFTQGSQKPDSLLFIRSSKYIGKKVNVNVAIIIVSYLIAYQTMSALPCATPQTKKHGFTYGLIVTDMWVNKYIDAKDDQIK